VLVEDVAIQPDLVAHPRPTAPPVTPERALARVKAQVEEKRFPIYDLYALPGWGAGDVARSLGVSRARVYLTKHRISALLKREIQRLSPGIHETRPLR